jgi:hypothetical protein
MKMHDSFPFYFSGKRLLASESSFVAEHTISKCLKKRADSMVSSWELYEYLMDCSKHMDLFQL